MARLFPDAKTIRLLELAKANIRQPSGCYLDSVTGPVVEFEPPLSAAEQAVYDDLVLLAKSGLDLTLAEFRVIKPDLQTMKTFNGLAAPTNAQRDANAKAANRVIFRALLRD